MQRLGTCVADGSLGMPFSAQQCCSMSPCLFGEAITSVGGYCRALTQAAELSTKRPLDCRNDEFRSLRRKLTLPLLGGFNMPICVANLYSNSYTGIKKWGIPSKLACELHRAISQAQPAVGSQSPA